MRIYIIVTILFLAALVATGGVVLRKDLPYQFDIVQKGESVAIVNQDVWNQRPLSVKVSHNGRQIAKARIDPKHHSEMFSNLPEAGPIAMEISREDLLGRLRYRPKTLSFSRSNAQQAYVVLLGASIGRAWKLEDFGHRVNEDKVVFSTRAHYAFDKTGTLTPLLNLKIRPDAIIIKQCSDYFPRDFKESAETVRQWVGQIKQAGIQPILATTVPVTADGPRKDRQAAIDKWNRFVQEFGRMAQVLVLDLAGAVQTAEGNTFLKESYAQEDGYHLTTAAYAQALDPLLKKFIEQELQFN